MPHTLSVSRCPKMIKIWLQISGNGAVSRSNNPELSGVEWIGRVFSATDALGSK